MGHRSYILILIISKNKQLISELHDKFVDDATDVSKSKPIIISRHLWETYQNVVSAFEYKYDKNKDLHILRFIVLYYFYKL